MLPLWMLTGALLLPCWASAGVGPSSALLASLPKLSDMEHHHFTSPVIVLEVSLPYTAAQFRSLWDNNAFYKQYLQSLEDKDIQISGWTSQTVAGRKVMQRALKYDHPVKYRVPGLGIPKYAGTQKNQSLVEEKSGKQVTIVVREINVISGVPYSDRFEVMCTWVATWEGADKPMRLVVTQEIVIKKPFMLEKTVEKNTVTETKGTLEAWVKHADSLLVPTASKTSEQPASSSDSMVDSKPRLQNLLQSLMCSNVTVKVLLCTIAAALILSSSQFLKTRALV